MLRVGLITLNRYLTRSVLHHRTLTSHKLSMVWCDVCSRNISDGNYNSHINGKRHRNAVYYVPLVCELCSCTCYGQRELDAHNAGRRHQRALRKQATQAPNPDTTAQNFSHRNGAISRELTAALAATENGQHGVEIIENSFDFGVVQAGEAGAMQLSIRNNGPVDVIILYFQFSFNTGIFRVEDPMQNRLLNRGKSALTRIQLVALDQNRGRYEDRLEAYFQIPSLKKQFTITRRVVATIGSIPDHDALQSTEEYRQSRTRKRKGEGPRKFFKGIRPQFLAKISWTNVLGEYPLPTEKLDRIFQDGFSVQQSIDRTRKEFEIDAFNASSYRKYMQCMLWVEEEKARDELERYNMKSVPMNPVGKSYELFVPGLAEKRPSVITGDSILVRTSGDEGPWFQGFVHDIREQTIITRFKSTFNGIKGQTYDVVFQLNRLVFRRMHQAMTCNEGSSWIAFPTSRRPSGEPIGNLVDGTLSLYKRQIQDNPAQLQAVTAITRLPPGGIPFIVYGPPGTGKTLTIVEAIRQILDHDPASRILACAPSNAAADLITERLSLLNERDLHRLMAPSRSSTAKFLPEDVRKFTRINEHGVFERPPREELEKYRVIVSTCSTASVPYGIGINPGHFTHIFVDEAGQATEAEVMIPIRACLGETSRVILSGDPKQLGPIVRSPIARQLGMGKSYLERLMENPLYDSVNERGRTFVKLTKNWRSHNVILRFPSDEFYNGELEACGDPAITHSLQSYHKLKRCGNPVIFHGICGTDRRERNSPSYFNIEEASLVKEYVQDLLEEKQFGLKPGDIGVIAPYRAQVAKIRSLLGNFSRETRVGSVEEFQGQERRVIIISTVRSTENLINFDLRHTLGFVANPRRFNVSVTRAQALLIVIGDPFVLSLDPLWKAFISYVYMEGTALGREINWDHTEPVDRTGDSEHNRRAQEQNEIIELIRRAREIDLGGNETDEVGAFNRLHREED